MKNNLKGEVPIIKIVREGEKEHETLECPYCGGEVIDGLYADSVDYHKEAHCNGCGCCWSE